MEFSTPANEEDISIPAKTTTGKVSKKSKRKKKDFDLEEDDITEGLFLIFIIFYDQFPIVVSTYFKYDGFSLLGIFITAKRFNNHFKYFYSFFLRGDKLKNCN